MARSFATALRNARADAITTFIGASGFLRVYDGTPPANANTVLSGNTLLAELALSATFAPAASGGVLTANAIANDASANNTGTASFYRLLRSDGTTVSEQGTVTATGGGGDMTFNTVSFVAGGPVAVSSFVSTEGNP